jgi:hypothetical protein
VRKMIGACAVVLVAAGGLFFYLFHLTPMPRPKTSDSRPPIENLVPDEQTAIAIAVAVLSPVYGAEFVDFEKPFRAILQDDVWHVEGSLPRGYLGGVAKIDISRGDARILSIEHTK